MKIMDSKKLTGGWFIGDFENSVLMTKDFEVSYKIHRKGEIWDKHTHKIATEYNFLIRGSMTICGEVLSEGTLFTIYPNEVADPIFHEDCEIICVKVPSVTGDKYIVE